MMVRKSVKSKLLLIFVAICFAKFIILFNFNVLLYNPDFVTGLLTNEDAIAPTEKLINYFQGTEDLPEVFQDQREVQHLKDVKSVINLYSISLFLLFLICLSYILFSKKQNIKKMFFLGSLFVFIFAILIVVFPFTPLFGLFHKILFANNSWLFPANSILIKFYPVSFFQSFLKNVLINSLIVCLPIFFMSKTISK